MRDIHTGSITMDRKFRCSGPRVLLLAILALKSPIPALKPLSVSVTFICHLESVPVPLLGVNGHVSWVPGNSPRCHIRNAGHGLEELACLFYWLRYCLLTLVSKVVFSFGRDRNIQAGLAPVQLEK